MKIWFSDSRGTSIYFGSRLIDLIQPEILRQQTDDLGFFRCTCGKISKESNECGNWKAKSRRMHAFCHHLKTCEDFKEEMKMKDEVMSDVSWNSDISEDE